MGPWGCRARTASSVHGGFAPPPHTPGSSPFPGPEEELPRPSLPTQIRSLVQVSVNMGTKTPSLGLGEDGSSSWMRESGCWAAGSHAARHMPRGQQWDARKHRAEEDRSWRESCWQGFLRTPSLIGFLLFNWDSRSQTSLWPANTLLISSPFWLNLRGLLSLTNKNPDTDPDGTFIPTHLLTSVMTFLLTRPLGVP